MAFISLEINIGTKSTPNWQYATLKDDVSIQVEKKSAIWDSSIGGGAFSYEFEFPVEDNLHILGTSCDMRGHSIYKQLYGKKFRLYAGGLLLFYGIVKIDETVEVEEEDNGNHTVSISLDSDNYEWEQLIEGIKARDVELATTHTDVGSYDSYNKRYEYEYNVLDQDRPERNIKLGYCVPSYFPVHVVASGYMSDDTHKEGKDPGYSILNDIITGFYIPKMLMVKASKDDYHDAFDYTNVQLPYPQAKYCNVTICYQHYVQASENSWEQKRGYGVGNYDRINSAPCFYVLYWLDLLMQDLGVIFRQQDNAFLKYEDLCRLAFYHTDCHYEEIPTTNNYSTKPVAAEKKDGSLTFSKMDASTHTDGIAVGMQIGPMSNTTVFPLDSKDPASRVDYRFNTVETDSPNCCFYNKYNYDDAIWQASDGKNQWVFFKRVRLYEAYANSDNFPDVEAKEIIENLQKGFGARFLYDAEHGSIRVIMLKDTLCQSVQETLPCIVNKTTKVMNHVTGFRLKYSGTEEAKTNAFTQKEDLTGVKQGTEGSDTTYSYNNYTNPIMLDPKSPEGKGYAWLLNHIGPYDKHCYIHPITGNAFRIKVDGDSKGGATMYPSLFEVGQMQKAEWGNCSERKDNKDFIEEEVIGFTPVIENDVNCMEEKKSNPDKITEVDGEHIAADVDGQRLAILVDGEIRSYNANDTDDEGNGKEGEFTEASVYYEMPLRSFDSYPNKSDARHYRRWNKTSITPIVGVTLYVAGLETWDLSGEEPTNTNDSGLTLGIMRGSGSDAHTEHYEDNYDGQENCKWIVYPGSGATFCSDSIDQYGAFYDYNGTNLPRTGYYSKQEAAKIIREIFPLSNADLTTTVRKDIPASTISGAGWIPLFIEGRPYYLEEMYYAEKKGHTYYVLTCGMGNDGTVFKPQDIPAYVQNLVAKSTSVEDIFRNDNLKLVVDVYVDQRTMPVHYRILLTQLAQIIYGTENEGLIYVSADELGGNGLGYDTEDAISLRLRAEKLNPGYNPDIKTNCTVDGYTYTENGANVTFKNGTTVPNTKYFPIDKSCARRGLADKFYSEYAYWVLNRNIANIECEMELATLVNLDMTKKYRIGQFEGFIKSLSYSIDNKTGLSAVEIEFYYL